MTHETKNTKAEANVAEAVSKTELFFRENGKLMAIILGVVVVLGLAVLAWYKLGYQPRKLEAQEQMFPAEANFRNSEYELALNGDGNVLGFSEIIREYGNKAGKAVYLYAGVCELQLGNYEQAISYLKKYNGKDKILLGRAYSCIGDSYVGLGDYAQATGWFEKAAKTSDNMFSATYLLKAGVTYEELGQADKALACYKEIKDQYPQSLEGYDIDKYISRIESRK